MSVPLVAGDFTGAAEMDWIKATLATLAGGRVWVTQVPANVSLPTVTNGGVKPYIIIRFAEPFSSTQGRSIAGGEQSQPHELSFTVLVIGGEDDSVRATMVEVRRRLVGLQPSLNAGVIRARGGGSFGTADNSGSLPRFERAAFFRVPING